MLVKIYLISIDYISYIIICFEEEYFWSILNN